MKNPAAACSIAAVVAAMLVMGLSSVTSSADDSTVIFQGYDPLWQDTVIIVERRGEYFMDGSAMEVLRHPNMPTDGLSLAMKDRIGRPDLYYLVLPNKLDI